MTKNELVTAIATKTNLPKNITGIFLDEALNVLADTMAAGEKIQIAGFGTFEVRQRNERTGKNPRSGEVVTIPACKVPSFKAGKMLKEKVNQE